MSGYDSCQAYKDATVCCVKDRLASVFRAVCDFFDENH